jgi:hypothetical protein
MLQPTVSRSVCLGPDFHYCQAATSLFIWGALSVEKTGLLFTIAADPRQRRNSRVLVPWDSWPYFTLRFLLQCSSSWNLGTCRVENTAHCCTSIASVVVCLFAKELFSNGCVYQVIKKLLPNSGCCFLVCFGVTGLHATVDIPVSNFVPEAGHPDWRYSPFFWISQIK